MGSPNDSIFSSAIRSFFNSFAIVLGFLGALTAAILLFASIYNTVSTPDKSTLTLSPDANGARTLLSNTTPVILRINIKGIIGDLENTEQKIQTLLLDSREDTLKNNRVKGILLTMNSPGGVANDADSIYRALLAYKRKYQIPIYTYVNGLCASGGMYIAAATDKIFSSPESLIGSVGIIMGPNFNVFEALQKIGVNSLTLTEGKYKDTLNPFRPWKEGEAAHIQKILLDLYDRFVQIVAEARPNLSKERLINEYGARVFIAPEAEKLGFIDNGNSEYNDALNELVKAAGIKENEKYQVLQIEAPQSIITELTQNRTSLLTGKVKHVFPLGPNLTSEMSGKFLYLYQPNN